MSTETNKALTRRFFEDVFGKGKLDLVDEMFAKNHVNQGPGAMPGLPDGPEGVRQFVTYYRNAFPDTTFRVEEQIADGDRVMTRWTAHGTQKGELPGIPVTGREATVSGVNIDRIENGKIVESWGMFDQLGMFQQLGLVSPVNQGGSPGQNRK